MIVLAAQDSWTEFRGPHGNGHAKAAGLPRRWSETENVRWKTAIHGRGWSSPVVRGGQVWLTTATPDGKELSAICVDRESGKILLDRVLFTVEKPEDTKKYNSYASPTPLLVEGRVVLHFGSYGTACLDTKTFETLWERRDLGCNHWRGPGSSPILHGGRAIIHFDGYDQQYVVALELKDGKTAWKTVRSHDYGTNDGDLKKGFATPTVVEVGGVEQLISPAAKAVFAYDPKTGSEIWSVRFSNHSAAARPFAGHGLLFISTGFSKGELLAIRPDGKGDVTGTHVVWKADKGVGSKPSPILAGDVILSVADQGGVALCLEAKTGKELWRERIAGGFSASPVAADGVIYFFDEAGAGVVLEPGPKCNVLQKNVLEKGCMASPAVAGKALYVRTESHLYRIENP